MRRGLEVRGARSDRAVDSRLSPSRPTRRAGVGPSAYGRAVDDPEERAKARADALAAQVRALLQGAVVVQVERNRDQERRDPRQRDVAALVAWAAGVLADPDTVILDTETTGFHDTARIVEIAVLTATGQVLLDTLVNPGVPIPAEATDIHRITDEMVAGSPSFGKILPDLRRVLFGKRVLIYNAEFDLGRLGHEINVIHGRNGDPLEVGERWLVIHDAKAEDAMIPYSDWVGEWNENWGNYRWQKLDGGHRALGDCLAVIDCLKAMARDAR